MPLSPSKVPRFQGLPTWLVDTAPHILGLGHAHTPSINPHTSLVPFLCHTSSTLTLSLYKHPPLSSLLKLNLHHYSLIPSFYSLLPFLSYLTKMSFTSKLIAPCCNKHVNHDAVLQNHHAPPTCIEETVFNGHGDFVSFVPAASMEGDDDDDDGSYDYAPAA
ncbi:hypothetical protein VNO80_21988 [Phaseolus coccineus]|uniref:Uncharacterized protein n=1 Tax=Phaseolus coccineus TaxID=3886 RepID=A0AAN9M8Z8_PHACN